MQRECGCCVRKAVALLGGPRSAAYVLSAFVYKSSHDILKNSNYSGIDKKIYQLLKISEITFISFRALEEAFQDLTIFSKTRKIPPVKYCLY